MTVEQFDQLFASMARPFTIYMCGTAVAVCCFIPETAVLALPLAAGLVAGAGYLRTVDKKNVSDAIVAGKQTDTSDKALLDGKPAGG